MRAWSIDLSGKGSNKFRLLYIHVLQYDMTPYIPVQYSTKLYWSADYNFDGHKYTHKNT